MFSCSAMSEALSWRQKAGNHQERNVTPCTWKEFSTPSHLTVFVLSLFFLKCFLWLLRMLLEKLHYLQRPIINTYNLLWMMKSANCPVCLYFLSRSVINPKTYKWWCGLAPPDGAGWSWGPHVSSFIVLGRQRTRSSCWWRCWPWPSSLGWWYVDCLL